MYVWSRCIITIGISVPSPVLHLRKSVSRVSINLQSQS